MTRTESFSRDIGGSGEAGPVVGGRGEGGRGDVMRVPSCRSIISYGQIVGRSDCFIVILSCRSASFSVGR